MKQMYIITGAAGHLGNTIIRALKGKDVAIRGLLLPHETGAIQKNVTYFHGDVRDKESLRPLFEHTEGYEVSVIHTAGIVDISEHVSPKIYEVNVKGTRHIVELCQEYPIRRLLYVSSVHAIPEGESDSVLHEIQSFSASRVEGGYAKTKAEATQVVLDAARKGLDAVVVHPSGILGPYDSSGNHLVQLVKDYIAGRLPACVHGGYDFVDVRDIANGCLLALEKGRKGECYILSNRHYEIKDVLGMVRKCHGGRRLPVLPMWMAKASVPVMQFYAKIKKQRPLYTKYSLYTLKSNDRFSHDKATAELGYRPRDLRQTIKDTVDWGCRHTNKRNRLTAKG